MDRKHRLDQWVTPLKLRSLNVTGPGTSKRPRALIFDESDSDESVPTSHGEDESLEETRDSSIQNQFASFEGQFWKSSVFYLNYKLYTVPTQFCYRTWKQRNKSEWVVTKMQNGDSKASQKVKNSVTKMRNVTKMSGDSIYIHTIGSLRRFHQMFHFWID